LIPGSSMIVLRPPILRHPAVGLILPVIACFSRSEVPQVRTVHSMHHCLCRANSPRRFPSRRIFERLEEVCKPLLDHLQRRDYLCGRHLQGDGRNNSSAAYRKVSCECPMIEELRDFAIPCAVQRELCRHKLPRWGLRGSQERCTSTGRPFPVKVPGAAGLTTITKPLSTSEELFPGTSFADLEAGKTFRPRADFPVQIVSDLIAMPCPRDSAMTATLTAPNWQCPRQTCLKKASHDPPDTVQHHIGQIPSE
jgi:hypothetical protein